MITSDKFIIRTIEQNDLEAIYKSSDQSFRGEYQEFTFSSKDILSRQFENGELFSDTFQMLLISDHEGVFLGLIYLNFKRVGLVSVGLVLCPNARHTGIGKQATKEITKYLFDNYPVARIEAETDILNVAAQQVLEGVGFVKEGIMRNYRFHHGKYNDSVLYSMIR